MSERIRVTQVLVAVVLAACSSPRANSRDTAAAPPATDTSPGGGGRSGAAPARPREIYIDSVRAENPLIVYGRARTFENTVQVRVRDERGDTIAEVFETSVGEMGHHNPFVARVWLTRDPGNRVAVEAFEYSANDGSVRSLMSKEVGIPRERMPLTLMFPTPDCSSTIAFTRHVPRSVGVARLLVEALVAGPRDAEKASGAASPFPPGSRVRSVILRDSVVTVDFNERLQNVGGACAAQAIRAAVTQTLTRLPAVRHVMITAGGSAELALQP